MKVYIAVDENNIVRCLVSDRCNIHKDKEHLSIYHVEFKGIVGDEYNAETDEWIPHPENYPKPSENQLNEAKIARKIRKLAIKSLKEEDEDWPEDYE